MVFILWLDVTLHFVGRILGKLIRCPLAFYTFFWLLAMNRALIHDWVRFISHDNGQLFAPPLLFPALSCIPKPLFCCVTIAHVPWDLNVPVSVFTGLPFVCTTLVCCRLLIVVLLIPVPLVVGNCSFWLRHGLCNIIRAPADFKIMPNLWELSYHELF